MKLTKEQVLHVAKLARLGLKEEEIEKFQKELSGILDYVEQLNEVDIKDITPTAQVTGLLNVMREDKISIDVLAKPDELLDCSPRETKNREIKVKSVF